MNTENLKPVHDTAHFKELLEKSADIYIRQDKVLSVMWKPAESKAIYPFAVYTKTGCTFAHVHHLRYKPKKIRRPYQPGDCKDSIVSVEGYTKCLVQCLIDLTNYNTQYPLVLVLFDPEENSTCAATFNYSQVSVEVEE